MVLAGSRNRFPEPTPSPSATQSNPQSSALHCALPPRYPLLVTRYSSLKPPHPSHVRLGWGHEFPNRIKNNPELIVIVLFKSFQFSSEVLMGCQDLTKS